MSSSIQSSLPAPALQASKAALNAALSDLESSDPGEVQEIEVDMALQAETLKTVFNDPKNFNVKVRVFFFLKWNGLFLYSTFTFPLLDLFDFRDG